MTITHKMQSGKTDSPDPSRVQPTNWNDEHDVSGLLGKLLPLTADTPGVPYLADDGSGAMVPSTAVGRALLAIDSLAALLTSLGAAPLDSPVFLNTPRAPTPDLLDNSTQLATTQFCQALIAALVNSSPSALDTLNELAAALGDDPNFATTVTTALGNRLRFDATQSLTSGQKAQALVNLGITLGTAAALNVGTGNNQVVQLDGSAKLPAVDGSALTNVTATNGAVRYDTSQSLSSPQQQQARSNSGSFGGVGQQVFTASGTFTTPADSTTSTVYHYRMQAGGGGGGGNNNASGASGGGGSGAYAEGTFTGIAPSTGISIGVGAGGTAGSNAGSSGGAGGASSIGAPLLVTCTGGGGGLGNTGATVTAGGAGGLITGGPNLLGISGQKGHSGVITNTSPAIIGGGDGANSILGIGGVPGQAVVSGPAQTAATGYGAGGAGGLGTGSAASAGSPGIVIIRWVQ